MNAQEARSSTISSLSLLSGSSDYFRAAIYHAVHQGFSNVLFHYEPRSGLWDQKAFDSLGKDGYRVELLPIVGEPKTRALVGW